MTQLILIRGIPGSGKTTIANLFNVDLVICADDFHVDDSGVYNWKQENAKKAHEWCQNCVKKGMEMNAKIAVHNTFTQQWELEPYFKLAAEYNYSVHTIIVENRHGNDSIHNVPDETLVKMRERFEVML